MYNPSESLLKDVRKALCENQVEFGKRLWKVVPGQRNCGHDAYTRQYINDMEHGRTAIPPKIARALTIILARLDGLDEVQAQAHEASVLTVHPLPSGTVILAAARACANPGCPVRFVPTCPQQKYHSPACQAQARNLRRKELHHESRNSKQ